MVCALCLGVLVYGGVNLLIKQPDINVGNLDGDTTSADETDVSPTVKTDGDGKRKDDYYTFLVCGTDQTQALVDTIMLVSFDTAQGKVNVLNIPRDTVSKSTRSIKKINGGYTAGEGKTDAELRKLSEKELAGYYEDRNKKKAENLKKEIGALTGVPIDFYAIINFEGFERVIDTIGGVQFDVPVAMKYSDPTQDLYIDLKPGPQLLNGKKALHFVRFRKGAVGSGTGYPEGDIGRINARKDFIVATLKQVANPKNILKYDDIAAAVFENTKTDMKTSDILWFGMRALKIDTQSIAMDTLPGADQYMTDPDYITNPKREKARRSYYVADEAGVIEMVNERYNPYVEPITKINLIDVSEWEK